MGWYCIQGEKLTFLNNSYMQPKYPGKLNCLSVFVICYYRLYFSCQILIGGQAL